MPSPLIRVAPVRLWVGDTGPLLQEVVQAARLGELTSMLAALHHDSARLYVARHVLAEMERDLPRYAVGRGVAPARAVAQWEVFYLPYIMAVNVPANWGRDDPRVAAVAARHPVDLPTAQLVVALAPCHSLIEDPDMADYGLGNRPEPGSKSSKWLALAHGSANQVQIDLIGGAVWLPSVIGAELGKAGARMASRLPGWAQLALLLAGGVGLYRWQTTGRAAEQLGQSRKALQRAGDVVLPIAATILAREAAASEIWQSNTVSAGPVSLSEELARCLALTDGPMTAMELAKQIGGPGALRTREIEIRDELHTCVAFSQISPGRWQLGYPASNREPAITELQVANWLRRAHGRPQLELPGSTQPAAA